MNARTRPTNARVKRRFAAIVIGAVIASYVSGNWGACTTWLSPSLAYLWKLPLLYAIAVVAYWFIVFGIFYNEDKDKSGDGAIAYFFLPLLPATTIWFFLKDAIREARIEARIVYTEHSYRKDPPDSVD